MIKYIEKLKGASDQDLNMWEVFYLQNMPADYCRFIRQSDGPHLQDDETEGEFQFFSLRKSIECFRSYLFRETCPNAIPICEDDKGNFAVYRIENSVIAGIYVMSSSEIDWESSTEIGQSIQDLLEVKMEDEVGKKE
jgi:SMI1/KNR4 family protein SUKH-1